MSIWRMITSPLCLGSNTVSRVLQIVTRRKHFPRLSIAASW